MLRRGMAAKPTDAHTALYWRSAVHPVKAAVWRDGPALNIPAGLTLKKGF